MSSHCEISSTAEVISTSKRSNIKPGRIGLFGIFGIQNLGNECTLEAMLANVRSHLPDSNVFAVSYDPDDTARRYGVSAIPVTFHRVHCPRTRRGGLRRLIHILRRVPQEIYDWYKAVKTLQGTELLIMTGTGMLTDYTTNFLGFPYDVFRWTAAARMAGCKVCFVGVGVGPIYGRMSRMMIRLALSMSCYRSFRDDVSKARIKKSGFYSDEDPIVPDLAFSLPIQFLPQGKKKQNDWRRVGVGVMDYRDPHLWNAMEHETLYSRYLEVMCDFVEWLITQGYSVRILQGDAKHDTGTRAALKAQLENRGISYKQAGIFDENSSTVQDIINQIADVDVVVSPRFHNLLLALMLGIPVLSISYDPKNDCLLEGVGLGNYRQQLRELDLSKLKAQFLDLFSHQEELKPEIESKNREYREALNRQYEFLFNSI